MQSDNPLQPEGKDDDVFPLTHSVQTVPAHVSRIIRIVCSNVNDKAARVSCRCRLAFHFFTAPLHESNRTT